MNPVLKEVLHIAEEAAEKILGVYAQKSIASHTKSDLSPVTEADLLAHDCILSGLSKLSDLPIVSEESSSLSLAPEGSDFWLVDPLDGTKDFLAGNGEFTVNIALISKGYPSLGVVTLPAQQQSYLAEAGKGAYRILGREQDSQSALEPLVASSRNSAQIAAISRFHDSPETQEFLERADIQEVKRFGSSLKMCQLAENAIDIYPRLAGTMEWDTAAAQCVCEESGCQVVDLKTGERLRYGKEGLRNPWFLALRPGISFRDYSQFVPYPAEH